MKKFLFIVLVVIIGNKALAQKTFKTDEDFLKIYVDGQLVVDNWTLNATVNPDIFEAEIKKKVSIVEYKDNKNTVTFEVKKGQIIDFIIIDRNNQTANQQIKGIEPNVNFTKKYIKKYQGKTIVEIPEVSELVNIIMVLHKDAEKDLNMFDTQTNYYERILTHFEPYRNHPIIDTIQKYIKDIEYKEDYKASVFSNESYWYYYAMKMNACLYTFNKNGKKITNKGYIKNFGFNNFDPMKDIELIEDFAKKSNFRKFYNDNKLYYSDLLSTYNQLNPIQKMQNWLAEKFKFSDESYMIYFSPLVAGAHSTKKFEANNFKQSFMFIARAEMDKDYSQIINELLESRVVFTEIDHNYVNPISDDFVNEINNSFSNREKWANGEQTSAYETNYKVFNEYMTFGVYSLYLLDNYTQADFEDFLPLMENQMEKNRGFTRFKDFNRELIRLYQQNKNQPMNELYIKILSWSSNVNSE